MLRELAHGVYSEAGYHGGVVGAVVTSRGALLIDAPMLPLQAEEWQSRLQKLGAMPVHGIVNTDDHLERLLGNATYMPARIWGHESSLKQITKYRTNGLEQLCNAYREVDPALADQLRQVDLYEPEVCVGDRATLHLGEREIRILHMKGHTPASLAVYLPKERILFAGDTVVRDEQPVMAQANSAAWIESLQSILALGVEVVVPGVGEPCGPDCVAPLLDYVSGMRSRVAELFRSGASRRECVDRLGLTDLFASNEEHLGQNKRRRREGIERIYAEVRSAEQHK